MQDASTLLRELGLAARAVRPVGGGTKPWGVQDGEPLETGGLDRILEHNVGDFTAVLEAGVPFAEAQALFAEHGQATRLGPAGPRRGDDRRDRGHRRTPARCATATAACATSWSARPWC